jgi:hypothetical protein
MSDTSLSSGIGAGSLFNRPNPAQILRKSSSSKSKIKQPDTQQIAHETREVQSTPHGNDGASDTPVPAPIGSQPSVPEKNGTLSQGGESSAEQPAAIAKKNTRYSLPEVSYQSTADLENRPLPDILQIGKVTMPPKPLG